MNEVQELYGFITISWCISAVLSVSTTGKKIKYDFHGIWVLKFKIWKISSARVRILLITITQFSVLLSRNLQSLLYCYSPVVIFDRFERPIFIFFLGI